MSRSLDRLFRPCSIAVVGGGAWCEQVITQSQRMGFPGTIHPVHPKASTLGGLPAVPRLEDLPTAPDAVFLGINRDAAITAMSTLSAMGAGGAVCFASGFAEAAAEDATGQSLQARLVAAAGPMPFLGPNCYGFINTLLAILEKENPTHLGVAFDTSAPTPRHIRFPAYKAQRDEMPEELAAAIPHVKNLCRAFHIPVLEIDGFEADDIIATYAELAAKAGAKVADPVWRMPLWRSVLMRFPLPERQRALEALAGSKAARYFLRPPQPPPEQDGSAQADEEDNRAKEHLRRPQVHRQRPRAGARLFSSPAIGR